jgi:hypothetical protein
MRNEEFFKELDRKFGPPRESTESRFGVLGVVRYELRNHEGKTKQVGEFHNLVTSIGDMFLAEFVATAITTSPKSFYAQLGVNTTAPLKADTALGTLISASSKGAYSAYPQRVNSFGTGAGEWTVWRYYWAAGETTNGSIGEIGLWTSTGSFVAHAQIAPNVNKASGDTLQIDWGWKFLGS